MRDQVGIPEFRGPFVGPGVVCVDGTEAGQCLEVAGGIALAQNGAGRMFAGVAEEEVLALDRRIGFDEPPDADASGPEHVTRGLSDLPDAFPVAGLGGLCQFQESLLAPYGSRSAFAHEFLLAFPFGNIQDDPPDARRA